MGNIKLLQLQFALFFKEIEERPDKLLYKIDEKIEGISFQVPIINQLPPGTPPEVPVAIMNSTDNKYTFSASKLRIDFMANLSNSNNSISVELDNFIRLIEPYTQMIFDYKNINRFGMVGNYLYQTKDPVKKLQSKYLNKELGELEELNIRFNKRFENNSYMYNNIVNFSQMNVINLNFTLNLNQMNVINTPPSSKQEGIYIQRDLNNVPTGITIDVNDVISVVNLQRIDFELSGIQGLIE